MMTGQHTTRRRIVILGAGGYLGSSLCRFFHGLSPYSVTALFRSAPSHHFFDDHLTADAFTDDWVEKIGSPPPFAVINCAFDFEKVGESDFATKYTVLDRNLAALRANDAPRLINVSTMSAYPGCRSDYGREKLFIERLFDKYGGINIRPGLIASWRRPGAAMLRLIDVTRNAKFVPILMARKSGFYFCDLEAVVLGLFLLLNLRLNKPHTLSFCYRDRLSLGKTVNLIEQRYAVRSPKVPIPWPAAYLLLRAKEAVLGKSKIRADSVLDFAYPAPFAAARKAFARVVDRYREELAALSRVERAPAGFYFLEGPPEGAEPRTCRLDHAIGDDLRAALGRFADA
jgi:nucleoside-diphosphate-sugar epimerase